MLTKYTDKMKHWLIDLSLRSLNNFNMFVKFIGFLLLY